LQQQHNCLLQGNINFPHETMKDSAAPEHSTGDHSRKKTGKMKKKSEKAPLGQNVSLPTWYRISFACLHTGRYVASTKRRITW
jgi:hypothetical protein